MNAFQKRTAWRIAAVSLLLASITSPLAWLIAREYAEDSIVSLAIEESRQLLEYYHAHDLNHPESRVRASEAANRIAGGLFNIVELYNQRGELVADAHTREGLSTELQLAEHKPPTYQNTHYQSSQLNDGQWVLRVFVPLYEHNIQHPSKISGYFEGVRIIPPWQKQQIVFIAFVSALMVALAALLAGLSIYPVVVRLSRDNELKTQEVLMSHLAMMEALGRAIAKRDAETGGHNHRVAWIATLIAEKLGVSGTAMQALIAGSFLHDIGKIGIPDAILLKPGKLDPDELNIMRTHVELGIEVVSDLSWLQGTRDIVACHHEKWDGSGYPQQLQGTNIPLGARIFAIADVFDALCSKRPYKQPLPLNEVLAILQQGSGSHFDPDILQVFFSMAHEIFAKLSNSSEAEVEQLLAESVKQHFWQ